MPEHAYPDMVARLRDATPGADFRWADHRHLATLTMGTIEAPGQLDLFAP